MKTVITPRATGRHTPRSTSVRARALPPIREYRSRRRTCRSRYQRIATKRARKIEPTVEVSNSGGYDCRVALMMYTDRVLMPTGVPRTTGTPNMPAPIMKHSSIAPHNAGLTEGNETRQKVFSALAPLVREASS